MRSPRLLDTVCELAAECGPLKPLDYLYLQTPESREGHWLDKPQLEAAGRDM